MKSILYLSTEIPALSETFVYNEIISVKSIVQKLGVASIRNPKGDIEIKALSDLNIFYIYPTSVIDKIYSFVKCLINNPTHTYQALKLLAKDITTLGIISRSSIGQIYRFINALVLAQYIQRNNYNHLHIHFAHVPTDVGMYAAKIADINFSVMAHANDIFERGWLLAEKIERSLFFATISNYNVKYLSQLTNYPKKLHIIRCGITTEKFFPRSDSPSNQIFKIGFVGRLVQKKGAIILLNAIKLLNDKGIRTQVELVGDGPEKDNLIDFISQDRLENVSLLGTKSNNSIIKWLNTLDCFVLPSIKDKNGDMDGIPVSLMEAMAIGIPVISTTVSGIPELVINQVTGLTCKESDATDLATTIEKLMVNNDATIKKLAINAQNHIYEEFEQRNNARRLVELINGSK